MLREGVLVQTCKVESQIKESLDVMEKLLEREMKRLNKVSTARLHQSERKDLVFIQGTRTRQNGDVLESC